MAKAQLEHDRARRLAERIKERLAPACERIEIAGSLRRRKAAVGDLELVAMPRFEPDGLFAGALKSALNPVLGGLVQIGKLAPLKSGDRYKQYAVRTVTPNPVLDLFLANEENYGLILALRTGPSDYSRRLVTPRRKGGLLYDGFRVQNGYLWRLVSNTDHLDDWLNIDGDPYAKVLTPTERDFYRFIHGGFVPPEQRK